MDQPTFIDLTPNQQIFEGLICPNSQPFSRLYADSGTPAESIERKVHFQILWQENTFPISLAHSETVGKY